jgi:hypothetical protein
LLLQESADGKCLLVLHQKTSTAIIGPIEAPVVREKPVALVLQAPPARPQGSLGKPASATVPSLLPGHIPAPGLSVIVDSLRHDAAVIVG